MPAGQGIIDEYRQSLFFSIIAHPTDAKEFVKHADTEVITWLRDRMLELKTTKIDGKETAVGQVLGTRVGEIADRLTEVIDGRNG